MRPYKIYKMLCFFILTMCVAKAMPSNHSTTPKSESCQSDNENPYLYTGMKTAYRFIHNSSAENITLPYCEPLQIWMLARHGARYPKGRRIQQLRGLRRVRDSIVDNHEKKNRGNLCDEDLQALKNWQPNRRLNLINSDRLTEEGQIELTNIGVRFTRRFPELLKHSSKNFKFRSTNTQRTFASAKSFIKGAVIDTFIPEKMPVDKDNLLMIYQNCKPWEKLNVTNETKAFVKGPEVAKVLADVSQRLGFEKILSFDAVNLFYDACRYERAWYPDSRSAWCVAFTDDDVRVLEYQEDLHHYYRFGPGMDINIELGCQPLKDMFERFTRLENELSSWHMQPKGVFYFTHSEMLMLFYSAMGIGKDSTPIKADNFREMADRNWRTSLLTPFAMNFAAVFHRCERSDPLLRVAFYLAEKPLTFEGCKDGVCDWEQVKRNLAVVATKCSTDFCQGKVA